MALRDRSVQADRHDAMHGGVLLLRCHGLRAVAHLVPGIDQDMHIPTGSQDLVEEAKAGDLVRDVAHIAPQTLVLQVGFANLLHVALCVQPP